MPSSGFYPPNVNLYLQKDHFLVAQVVKNLPAMQETQIPSLGWEDPLEKEMTTHSITLAWRIPWTGEPGGLQSTGSQSWTWLSSFHFPLFIEKMGFLGGASDKEPTGQFRRQKRCGSIPGLGRTLGGGHSNPLQYSCLENPHRQRSPAGYIKSMGLQRVQHDWSNLAQTHRKDQKKKKTQKQNPMGRKQRNCYQGPWEWRRDRLYKKPQVNLGGSKNILYFNVTWTHNWMHLSKLNKLYILGSHSPCHKLI